MAESIITAAKHEKASIRRPNTLKFLGLLNSSLRLNPLGFSECTSAGLQPIKIITKMIAVIMEPNIVSHARIFAPVSRS